MAVFVDYVIKRDVALRSEIFAYLVVCLTLVKKIKIIKCKGKVKLDFAILNSKKYVVESVITNLAGSSKLFR